MGKGDKRRPGDTEAYRSNHERIFGVSYKKRLKRARRLTNAMVKDDLYGESCLNPLCSHLFCCGLF